MSSTLSHTANPTPQAWTNAPMTAYLVSSAYLGNWRDRCCSGPPSPRKAAAAPQTSSSFPPLATIHHSLTSHPAAQPNLNFPPKTAPPGKIIGATATRTANSEQNSPPAAPSRALRDGNRVLLFRAARNARLEEEDGGAAGSGEGKGRREGSKSNNHRAHHAATGCLFIRGRGHNLQKKT